MKPRNIFLAGMILSVIGTIGVKDLKTLLMFCGLLIINGLLIEVTDSRQRKMEILSRMERQRQCKQ